jgi:hypothetical protein
MTPFFSIATLFLSIAVVAIAWQQWRVADNKLRLDLFDRRYKVYDATRKFLDTTIGEGYTDSRLVEFNVGTSDAEFLFGAEVVEYIREILRRAGLLVIARKAVEPSTYEISDHHVLPEREGNAHRCRSRSLKRGGCDCPSNMQWQTTQEAKAKDKWE